jgi:hypothetical protein
LWKKIRERLGHGSITITMDRSGHLLEGVQDRKAIQVLEARRNRLLLEKETKERGRQDTEA